MMFIILDKDPIKAVHALINSTPKQFWSKQLIELGQLISSTGISTVFDPIPRGKQIQAWIRQFPHWTLTYYKTLYTECKQIIHYKPETIDKLDAIYYDLYEYCTIVKQQDPDYFIFRFAKEYECNYETNQSLPTGECIHAYQKYIAWKCFDKGWN